MVSAFGPNVGLTKGEQTDFFRSIGDSRFLEICGAVDGAHIADVFHLWTAEAAGLDAFLTMDRRFLRVMKQKRRRAKSSVSVWSPKELCGSLGEGPTDIEALAAQFHPFR